MRELNNESVESQDLIDMIAELSKLDLFEMKGLVHGMGLDCDDMSMGRASTLEERARMLCDTWLEADIYEVLAQRLGVTRARALILVNTKYESKFFNARKNYTREECIEKAIEDSLYNSTNPYGKNFVDYITQEEEEEVKKIFVHREDIGGYYIRQELSTSCKPPYDMYVRGHRVFVSRDLLRDCVQEIVDARKK